MLKHTWQPPVWRLSLPRYSDLPDIGILTLHGMFLLVAMMARSCSLHRAGRVTKLAKTYHAYSARPSYDGEGYKS
jgi:hypothetical protein